MSDRRADRRPDHRFARRPAWIAGHVLAGATVVLFVGLGFWQLDRLDARKARNELVVARAAAEPVDVGETLDPGSGAPAVDEVRFSPLALADGEEVMVLRGFVAQGADGTLVAPDPPAGEVTVDGLAIPVRRLE